MLSSIHLQLGVKNTLVHYGPLFQLILNCEIFRVSYYGTIWGQIDPLKHALVALAGPVSFCHPDLCFLACPNSLSLLSIKVIAVMALGLSDRIFRDSGLVIV